MIDLCASLPEAANRTEKLLARLGFKPRCVLSRACQRRAQVKVAPCVPNTSDQTKLEAARRQGWLCGVPKQEGTWSSTTIPSPDPKGVLTENIFPRVLPQLHPFIVICPGAPDMFPCSPLPCMYSPPHHPVGCYLLCLTEEA